MHGQALTDLSHHLNSLYIHYIESKMSTSQGLELQMINAGKITCKVKKLYEEYVNVIQSHLQSLGVCDSNEVAMR